MSSDRRKPSAKKLAQWHAGFTAGLAKIMRAIRHRLRHLRGERRDTAEGDAKSIAWENYAQLCEEGRDPEPLLGKIGEFAGRKVRYEYEHGGGRSVRELLAYGTRRKHGYRVLSLEEGEEGELPPEVAAACLDRKTADPGDEAAANLDFQAWLESLGPEQRDLAAEFASGKNNTQVGELHGCGRGSGSAWRRELHRSWRRYCGGRE